MKINLRKASVVLRHLDSEMSQLRDSQPTLAVNPFETNPSELLDRRVRELEEAKEKGKHYLKVSRFLKTEVAKCNLETEVNDLLAEDAMLRDYESLITNIFELKEQHQIRPSDEAVKGLLEQYRQSEESYRYRYNSFYVISHEKMEELKSELDEIKRERRRIKDRLVVINVNTSFEVPEWVVEVMREFGLD
jgi:DNA polymerase III alpha subunit